MKQYEILHINLGKVMTLDTVRLSKIHLFKFPSDCALTGKAGWNAKRKYSKFPDVFIPFIYSAS